jgi:hypothetical protein
MAQAQSFSYFARFETVLAISKTRRQKQIQAPPSIITTTMHIGGRGKEQSLTIT